MQSPFLIGDSVYLRPHIPEDLESDWYQWFNDADVTRFMFKGVFPNTREEQSAYLSRLGEQQRTRTHLQLAVVHREADTLIGIISLGSIDWVNRSAEIGMVIGDRRFRGRHNGLEAMALLMHHGFSKMNLNRIHAGQHVGLWKWKEALKRHLGWVEEGVLRQAMFAQGRFNDVIAISVIAEDWWRRWSEAGETISGLLEPRAEPDVQRG